MRIGRARQPIPLPWTKRCGLLQNGQRPVIVVGHGVELSGAEPELLVVAEALAHSRCDDAVRERRFRPTAFSEPGPTGRNGSYMANAACRNADVILALGTRFDDRATSAWLPGFTYNIPPTQADSCRHRRVRDRQKLPAGDRNHQRREAVSAAASRRAHHAEVDASAARGSNELLDGGSDGRQPLLPPRTSEAIPIRPERAVADLRKVVPADGIVLADVGIHHNWLVAEYEAWKTRTFLQTWGFASMGFAVAGAVGAKLAAPDQPVMSLCGDGAFMMNASAVLTAVEYNIPVVWMVWNNFGYCAIRDQQRGYFGNDRELATSFTDANGNLFSADYAMMARSMGAVGETVEKPADLAPQLEAAIASGRPTVLDVRIDREIRPLATGSWDLPPIPHPMPNFGWGEDE